MSQGLYTPEKIKDDFEVPDVLLPLVVAHPRLLPGETRDEYYLLLDLMVGTVAPDTDIEWLAVIDLAWLQWEIQRYRRWKNAIIMSNRAAALETALCKTDDGAAMPGAMKLIRGESKKQAQEMIINPNAHREARAKLESHGYDADAINAGAFVHSIIPLATIEKLLSSARHQVTITLREVAVRREFERRAREAMKRIDIDVPAPETKQIEAR
ncbi:MAG: hypothetical protein QOJ15_526 [Bradyrhizobium sp.]|jgi:hypothetical protein|nr:hypothetical protein [Bradyrhizobium sp.]